MMPVVSKNPMAPAVLPTADSWQWFTETDRSRVPAWRNEVTLRSVEKFLEYKSGAHIAHISPTSLMMVVALRAHLAVKDEASSAYERSKLSRGLSKETGRPRRAGPRLQGGFCRRWFPAISKAQRPRYAAR